MFPRALIKKRAKQLFFNQYWTVLWIVLVFTAIIAFAAVLFGGVSALSALMEYYTEDFYYDTGLAINLPLAPITLGVPLLLIVFSAGICQFSLEVYRGLPARFSALFQGFSRFGHVLGGMLWMALWIFVWSLLFLIGGFVRAYAYRLTPYILLDQPQIGARDALKLSIAMTQGYKWKLFVMDLSFLGWNILNWITGGILGIFFTTPYQLVAYAGAYEELRAVYTARTAAPASAS